MPLESQFLVGLHELIEAYLCHKDGVTDQQVCDHDQMFEEERERGLHHEEAEPGDDERSPYRKQHQIATEVEQFVCEKLGISWTEHSQSVLGSEADHPKT